MDMSARIESFEISPSEWSDVPGDTTTGEGKTIHMRDPLSLICFFKPFLTGTS